MKRSELIKGVVYIVGACALLVTLIRESEDAVGAEITPYVEAGVYKFMSTTDPMLRDNGDMGSTTPGILGAGLKTEFGNWKIKAGWLHQSYLNRGQFIHKDYGGKETYWDGLGVRVEYEFKSLSFKVFE